VLLIAHAETHAALGGFAWLARMKWRSWQIRIGAYFAKVKSSEMSQDADQSLTA
jgi:hypothetical protein